MAKREITKVEASDKINFIFDHIDLFNEVSQYIAECKRNDIGTGLTEPMKKIAKALRKRYGYSSKTGDYDLTMSWMRTYEEHRAGDVLLKQMEEMFRPELEDPVDEDSLMIKKIGESESDASFDPNAIEVNTSVIKHIDFTTYDAKGNPVHLVLHVNEKTGEINVSDAVMNRVIISGRDQIPVFAEVLHAISHKVDEIEIAQKLKLPF